MQKHLEKCKAFLLEKVKTRNKIILIGNNESVKEDEKVVNFLTPISLTSLKALIVEWQKKINHLKMRKSAD